VSDLPPFDRYPNGARVYNTDDGREFRTNGSATVTGFDITREVYIVELDEWTAPGSEWHKGRDTWMRRETHLSSRQPDLEPVRPVYPGEYYFLAPHAVPNFTGRPVKIMSGPNEAGLVSVRCTCLVHVSDLAERHL
jgi:hypothetical protein